MCKGMLLLRSCLISLKVLQKIATTRLSGRRAKQITLLQQMLLYWVIFMDTSDVDG